MAGRPVPGSQASLPRATARSLFRDLLLPPDFYRERQPTPVDWVEAIFEPVALVTIVACFAAGLVAFMQSFAPEWDSRFALPLSLVVATEGFLYTRRFHRPALLPKEWLALLIPVAVVLRALMLLPERLGDPLKPINPTDLADVFSAAYVANLVVLLVAWLMSTDATHKLNAVRLRRGEARAAAARSAQRDDLYDNSWRLVDHATPLRELTDRLLWGGFALVALAGFTAINDRESFSLETLLRLVTFARPSLSLALSNVVIYFVVSLLLISEAQLARHRTSWQLADLQQPPSLGTRWVVQTLAVVAGLLALSLILPVDIVAAVTVALGLIGLVLTWMSMALMFVFIALIAILSWPFRLLRIPTDGAPPESAAQPPAVTGAEQAPPEWLGIAQTALVWLLILAVIAFALRALWINRSRLPSVGIVGLLVSFAGLLALALGRLLTLGRGAAAWVRATLPVRRVAEAVQRVRPRLGVHLSRLGPRELIEYYFLSTAQRAAKLGLAMRRGETAREYASRLPQHAPDLDPALSDLTDSFDSARYGPRPVGKPEVTRAKLSWEMVRQRLRRRRQIR